MDNKREDREPNIDHAKELALKLVTRYNEVEHVLDTTQGGIHTKLTDIMVSLRADDFIKAGFRMTPPVVDENYKVNDMTILGDIINGNYVFYGELGEPSAYRFMEEVKKEIVRLLQS
jgi:hypothetical protein